MYAVEQAKDIEALNQSDAEISLHQAVQQALKGNPVIESSRAQYNAQAKIPDQMYALPEPRLLLNAANLPMDGFSLSETPMTQMQIGISQSFPFPGKLALKQSIAENESLASREIITSNKNFIVKRVKFLWWQLFYLDRSLETVANNIELLTEFIVVAETKYTVGQGLQQDVLLAHVELAKLEDSKLQLESMRQKTIASFNALLNRETSTNVVVTTQVSKALPEIEDITQLVAQAVETRPEVKKAIKRMLAAEGRTALAEKDYYPDFQLGGIYGWRQDQTALASVQFSMNLPFNTEKRQDKMKDQRNYEWLQQKYSLDDLKNSIAEEVHQAVADYTRSKKQTFIFQDRIIPQATQTVESMLVGYQVNKVDFLNLLQSQVNLFNFQTQYWLALSSANQALAALEYAVGKEVVYEK